MNLVTMTNMFLFQFGACQWIFSLVQNAGTNTQLGPIQWLCILCQRLPTLPSADWSYGQTHQGPNSRLERWQVWGFPTKWGSCWYVWMTTFQCRNGCHKFHICFPSLVCMRCPSANRSWYVLPFSSQLQTWLLLRLLSHHVPGPQKPMISYQWYLLDQLRLIISCSRINLDLSMASAVHL